MPSVNLDGLTLVFPAGWTLIRFDETAFYRNRFQAVIDGVKAVDLIAISPERTLYLIEAKDYRNRRRQKPGDIGEEFIRKVLSTLAALLPAKLNASDADERDGASRCLEAERVKLCLHLDQSPRGTRGFPPVVDAANLSLRLRKRLKPIGGRPIVCSRETSRHLPWTIGRDRSR